MRNPHNPDAARRRRAQRQAKTTQRQTRIQQPAAPTQYQHPQAFKIQTTTATRSNTTTTATTRASQNSPTHRVISDLVELPRYIRGLYPLHVPSECEVCGCRYTPIRWRLWEDCPVHRWRARVVSGPNLRRTRNLCSPECRRLAEAARHRARWARQPREPASYTVSCESCGDGFTAGRSSTRFCSTRCRVAAHRARGA